MPKKTDKKVDKDLEKKKKTKAVAPPDEHEHVPVEAENFEHTLKRLITERDEKRSTKAGIYR